MIRRLIRLITQGRAGATSGRIQSHQTNDSIRAVLSPGVTQLPDGTWHTWFEERH